LKNERKNYVGAEKGKRFNIFKKNLLAIKKYNKGKNSDQQGLTPFAALTDDEFKSTYLTSTVPSRGKRGFDTEKRMELDAEEIATVPTARDWRKSGKVTSIKNQGSCGSCWAFSTAAVLESAWAIAGHALTSLSPQQVVDCSADAHGCSGGWVGAGLDDIVKYKAYPGGLHTWGSYAYHAVKGTCKSFSTSIGAKTKGHTVLTKSYSTFRTYLGTRGPVAVHIDATYWKYYTGGVLTRGSTSTSNHAVVAVGYGTTSSGVPVWIVKNSWGTGWGMSGYCYIKRSSTTNYMGVLNWAVVPIL